MAKKKTPTKKKPAKKKSSPKKKASSLKKKSPTEVALGTIVKSIRKKSPEIDVSVEKLVFVVDGASPGVAAASGLAAARWVCRFRNGKWQCGWE